MILILAGRSQNHSSECVRTMSLANSSAAGRPNRSVQSFSMSKVSMNFRHVILLGMILGCSTKPILVPIASVHYDALKEAKEIIATLKAHGIAATPAREATVVFPILVPKNKFECAVSILRTNSLVSSGKVRLYSSEWEEK